MSNFLFYFSDVIRWGFTITLCIMLAAYFIKAHWRYNIKLWLFSTYLLVFVYCLMTIIAAVTNYLQRPEFSYQSTGLPKYEGYNFYYTSNYGLYFYPLLMLLILPVILLVFKRIRNTFAWGFLALPALQYENIRSALWYLYKDYRPSGWTTDTGAYPFNKYVFCFIVFNAGVLGIYLLLMRSLRKIEMKA